jgi:hypothetical protein
MQSRFLPTMSEIDLLALTSMRQYRLTSIFDVYPAATVLNQIEDRVIISTNNVFDSIPELTRIDSQTLVG